MTQAQINRSEMFDTVQAYLKRNTEFWSSTLIIEDFVTQLDDLVRSIADHKKDQNAAKVFVHKSKKAQKSLVAEMADILNDALAAYGTMIEDAELEYKADKSYSDLNDLRNEDFETVIKETIKLLDENLTHLADYGVTEPQLIDLKNNFDTFLELNGQPRQYRIASVVATSSLKELFTKTNLLLTKKLDRVMKGFKNKEPEFYKGYLAARVVVNK